MTPISKPAGNDSKAKWAAYAKALGIDPKGMSRDELIEAVKDSEVKPEKSPAEDTEPETEEVAEDNPAISTEDSDADESSEGSFADLNGDEDPPSSPQDTVPATGEVADDNPALSTDKDGNSVEVEFLESGLTFRGRVWLKGDTLKVEIGSSIYEKSKNTMGDSWLDLAGDPEAQKKRWGRHMFKEI